MHQQPPPSELMTVQRFGVAIATDVSLSTLANLVTTGQVRADDVLLRPGARFPMPAGDVPGLFSTRSFTMALVLSIVLGFFGADRFYLGHTVTGIAKLLVGVASVGVTIADTAMNGLAGSLSLTILGLMLQVAQFAWYATDIVRIATRRLPDGSGRRLR